MPDTLKISRIEDPGDPVAAALVAKSDAYLDALYPPESNHAEALEALTSRNVALFGGYLGEELVACAAAKILEQDGLYGEIKRVYVAEQHRGKRIATALMEFLERFLSANGVEVVRLETGTRQPEALGLYRKLGYAERGPFGHYTADSLSVFMEKALRD